MAIHKAAKTWFDPTEWKERGHEIGNPKANCFRSMINDRITTDLTSDCADDMNLRQSHWGQQSLTPTEVLLQKDYAPFGNWDLTKAIWFLRGSNIDQMKTHLALPTRRVNERQSGNPQNSLGNQTELFQRLWLKSCWNSREKMMFHLLLPHLICTENHKCKTFLLPSLLQLTSWFRCLSQTKVCDTCRFA